MNVPHRQTSALAVISLVTGILGVFPAPFLASVVAVVTGHLARAEIRRAPERFEGDGMALAGLVLGYLMIAIALAGVALVFLVLGGVAWLGMVL
ncbi:DUF4190 domain-containing protein [Luteimonas sp. JM171]|uniref:DUF4190 domain-containing protein n=1 Tax=Luteimonas sp. JM171 TaxID=1896164 RepID=UPI000857B727|nr:DUF4190 domain-containing protein [Luteimonas sp. JM171]AOH36765.1 hypothetical protein BGP89_10725 [Luteimonas sp. JM171]